jgi:hypothetical protein
MSSARDNADSEFGTRLSSPSSSAKHTFSVSGSGTSLGRSSVGDRSFSARAEKVDLSVPTDPEELEAKGEAIAERLWEEDESFKSREKFSEWLGKECVHLHRGDSDLLIFFTFSDPLSAVARKCYMDRFDFSSLRVDGAFRYVIFYHE